MVMMKKLCFAITIWLALTEICLARPTELHLDASNESLSAGGHICSNLEQGYIKTGIMGVYADDDDETEFKWGGIRVVAGNDTIVKGLTCEVGLFGLVGDAKYRTRSGDIGALAFSIQGKYLFPEHVVRIPIEVFNRIAYAPNLLSFLDTERFFEFSLGAGVQVIKNALVTLTYTRHQVDLDSEQSSWDLDENIIRAGIMIRF
jgi:hypothetical protein